MYSCCYLEFSNCIEEILGGALHFPGVVTNEVGWEHIGVQVTRARVGPVRGILRECHSLSMPALPTELLEKMKMTL